MIFFFLLALNCNTVFAVLKFYSGVTDLKDSWEVLVIWPRFYLPLFSIWGSLCVRLSPSAGLASTEAIPSYFWFSDPISSWTPQKNIRLLAVRLLSAKPSYDSSSSALSLILWLKRLLPCFSTVGGLRHSLTFFQCSLSLCPFWFPKWQLIALHLSCSLQQGVEQKAFHVGVCLTLLGYPISNLSVTYKHGYFGHLFFINWNR